MMGHASATVRQFTVTLTLPQGLQSTYITVLRHINYSELAACLEEWSASDISLSSNEEVYITSSTLKLAGSADYRYNGLSLHLGIILKEETRGESRLAPTRDDRYQESLSLVWWSCATHATQGYGNMRKSRLI